MTPLVTLPIEPMGERFPNHSRRGTPRKPTDIKIHDLIRLRMSLPMLKEGGLLASATAPQVVIPASHSMNHEEKYLYPSRQRRPALVFRRAAAVPLNYFPLGLDRCEPHNWINALMQFLLFIPLLREIFSYTPTSFRPFNEFIDQYFSDWEEKRLVSRANSYELVRTLLGKFPQFFKISGTANLHEIIQSISHCACAYTSFNDSGFRSDWQILWDSNKELSLQEIFERIAVPPELLIVPQLLYDPVKRKNSHALSSETLRRQYFSTQEAICYDLDAFIEHRMEEGESACYYTYLKVDGTWIQCADERIVPLRRSTLLDLPLRRGILFHYRRVWIGQNCTNFIK